MVKIINYKGGNFCIVKITGAKNARDKSTWFQLLLRLANDLKEL
jgi:hypothetical protein